jgi:antitoxin (DNA-binding transcriptional repressor) of toxin-antitoxin stability system
MTTRSVLDAKSNLPAILDSVEKGEPVIICSHGDAVAELEPFTEDDERKRKALEAIEWFHAWREQNKGRFAGISIRELIDEGRRY